MKNLYQVYILLALTLIVSVSCNKQLDALPENAKVEGNTIVDQPSANIALNGAYYVLANADNTQIKWSANKVLGSMAAGYIAYGAGSYNEEVNNFALTTYTDQWGRYYSLINAANGVISGVNSLPDSKFVGTRKAQIIAESRFLRAYASFKLLSLFGQWFDINSKYGIIIADQFNTLTNINKPRSSVKDSYAFIVNDLDYAIANGAATAVNTNIYANKWTAMALKMRVLLSRGQADDYPQSVTLGNTILSGSPYRLENRLQDVFYTKGLQSSEVMLGIQPQAGQELLINNENTSLNFASARPPRPFQATAALRNLYAGDPRQNWVVGNAVPGNKTFYFIKYVQQAQVATRLSEAAYAFRLTEVYLMLAEATVRSGGDLNAARTLLKTVLSKAGVTDFNAVDNAGGNDALLIQLYYEYARNLVGEDGSEWLALLRLPFNTVKTLRPSITSQIQYILPIPRSEIVNNPNFGDQNPGYQR